MSVSKNKLAFGLWSSVFCLWSVSAFALLQGNRIVLVENYENPKKSEASGNCVPGFVTGPEAFGGAGTSLSVDYDVSAPDSSCSVSLGVADLSGMGYLSFWVKSQEGNTARLQFMVELREGKNRASEVPTSGFSGKVRPDGWKKVVIPLSQFREIQQGNQVLEIVFVLQSKWRIGRGRLLVDDVLFGTNYPEGLAGREILMQNRVSSFKIGGNRIADAEVRLKQGPTSLTLTLTFVDPYLEEIRFEESDDKGNEWRRIQSFFDQTNGGVYEAPWEPAKEFGMKEELLIRAVGVNLFGGETELVGPYRIHLD